MTFSWRPRHSGHAIELMSFNVNLLEPLPQRGMQRIQQSAAENLSRDVATVDRSVSNGFQIVNGNVNMEPMGLQLSVPATPEQHQAGIRISEHLDIQPQQISYRTWSYTDWDEHFAKIRRWLTDPLDRATSVVAVQSIRLEYQDRFYFEGDPVDAPTADLLRRDSGWIAPHVFELTSGWHSHTGRFVSSPATDRAVLQLNADVHDLPFPPPPNARQTRWINIMTAYEDRYDFSGVDPDDLTADFLFDRLQDMHRELSNLMRIALTDEALASINMKSRSVT